MTKEEFKAKAKEIIDNEPFGTLGVLFDYKDISQMKVAQVDEWDNLDNAMPFMDFLDELYEQMSFDIKKESIPYLMHKEMDIPISECQKAYDVAIEYLRSQVKVKG